MDTLNSNIPVPKPFLFSVISSSQGGTHQMSDNICDYDKNEGLMKSRDCLHFFFLFCHGTYQKIYIHVHIPPEQYISSF
jgi:hypothetical protein